MHWSLTQKCAVLRLALVDPPNELQNTRNLIYWKFKTLSFVGRGVQEIIPSQAGSKDGPKSSQFSGEVPSALLDCFSSFLAIPWTSLTSLESPPPSLMFVWSLGGWSPSYSLACLEFVLKLKVSSLVLKWGLSRRLLGGVFCGLKG